MDFVLFLMLLCLSVPSPYCLPALYIIRLDCWYSWLYVFFL